MTTNLWTIAYRKPSANRFQRAQGVDLTWAAAVELARVAADLNPGLQIYYVPTAETEARGAAEDHGNILVDSGKRVRITENGSLGDLGLTAIDARAAEEAAEAKKRAEEPTPAPAENGPENRSQGPLNVPTGPRVGRKSHRNPNRRAQRKSQRAARRVNRTR